MNKKLGQRNSGAIRRSLRPIIRARHKHNSPILAFINRRYPAGVDFAEIAKELNQHGWKSARCFACRWTSHSAYVKDAA